MFTFDFSRRVEFASICFVFGNANILDFAESIEVLGIRIPTFMKILYVTEVNLVFDLYENSFYFNKKTIQQFNHITSPSSHYQLRSMIFQSISQVHFAIFSRNSQIRISEVIVSPLTCISKVYVSYFQYRRQRKFCVEILRSAQLYDNVETGETRHFADILFCATCHRIVLYRLG